MASNYRPGGGVKKGSSAQEEDIFRRSNYFLTLNKSMLPDETYPLKATTVIYSPSVVIIKDSNYNLLNDEDLWSGSFLACPAIRNPQIKKIGNDVETFKRLNDYDLMKDKIEMCYKTALHFGHDSLVLGALGCGAFNNPPHTIANIFAELNQKYALYFKKIGFAILSTGNNQNFNIFKKKLG